MCKEPGFIANDHGHVLKREKESCGTTLVDYASDLTFHFAQTSTEEVHTVVANHKFERLTKKK